MPDAIVAQVGFDINHLRLLIGEKTLIGALIMGDQTLSTPLQKLVANKADISPIREKLLMHDAKIADVIADFWKEWQATSGR
jgi:NAD(P)H-nitrite reductase large subunit